MNRSQLSGRSVSITATFEVESLCRLPVKVSALRSVGWHSAKRDIYLLLPTVERREWPVGFRNRTASLRVPTVFSFIDLSASVLECAFDRCDERRYTRIRIDHYHREQNVVAFIRSVRTECTSLLIIRPLGPPHFSHQKICDKIR